MATIKWYNPDTDEWEYVGVGSSDSGGSGDVVGPSSATDNAIARFDSTTGKLIQNSSVLLTDGGNIEFPNGTTSVIVWNRNTPDADVTMTTTTSNGGGFVFSNYIEAASVGLGGTDYAIGSNTYSTLTNKRTNPRVISTTSASSLTPSIASADQYNYTALAAALTINAPTGTPVDGNKLMFRFKDNGTSRTLTWNSAFRAIGVTLPTATTVSKTVYIGAIYNSSETVWDVIAVAQEA